MTIGVGMTKGYNDCIGDTVTCRDYSDCKGGTVTTGATMIIWGLQ